MFAWKDVAAAAGWTMSGSVAAWHVVAAESLWIGAVLAALGLLPGLWKSARRLVEGPDASEWQSPPISRRITPQDPRWR